jgi:hypothetical protein
MILNRINPGGHKRPRPPKDHYMILLVTDPEYSIKVYNEAQRRTRLLKSNVCYILECNRMPILTFFKLLNSAGCKLSYAAWVKSERDVLFNSFVIFTMAYVLQTDLNTLFAEDITEVYKPR